MQKLKRIKLCKIKGNYDDYNASMTINNTIHYDNQAIKNIGLKNVLLTLSLSFWYITTLNIRRKNFAINNNPLAQTELYPIKNNMI